MRRRMFATAGAGVIGAATAVVALVVGTTAGFAATTKSFAYGIEAIGPIPIEPTPYIESTDGTEQTSTAIELPDNPLVVAAIIDLMAGDDTASVQIARVLLPAETGLPDELAPLADALKQISDALTPLCDADTPALPENPLTDALPVDLGEALDPAQLCEALENPARLLELKAVEVSCDGDTGMTKIAEISLLGQEVPIPPLEPNTEIIPANPLLALTANKQVAGEDGSFSVTGLEVNIGDGEQIINLGNATCGAGEKDDNPPTATPPPPVTTGLPVTG